MNIGSDQRVTINQLVDTIEAIAGVKLKRRYKPGSPRGVRDRNSDNTLIMRRLGWAPSINLEDGIQPTYAWISREMIQVSRRTSA